MLLVRGDCDYIYLPVLDGFAMLMKGISNPSYHTFCDPFLDNLTSIPLDFEVPHPNIT